MDQIYFGIIFLLFDFFSLISSNIFRYIFCNWLNYWSRKTTIHLNINLTTGPQILLIKHPFFSHCSFCCWFSLEDLATNTPSATVSLATVPFITFFWPNKSTSDLQYVNNKNMSRGFSNSVMVLLKLYHKMELRWDES